MPEQPFFGGLTESEVRGLLDREAKGQLPENVVGILGKLRDNGFLPPLNAPPRQSLWAPEKVPPPPDIPKTFSDRALEGVVEGGKVVLPATGAVVGGTLGVGLGGGAGLAGGPTAPVSVPAGAFWGGVTGAGAGAGIGEAAQMGLERLIYGKSAAPPSFPAGVSRVAQAATTGMTGEAVGGSVIGAAGKVLKPFAKKVTAAGTEAMRRLSGHVTPAQVVDSRLLRIAENVSEASISGGERMEQFGKTQQSLLDMERQGVQRQYGRVRSPHDAGEVIKTDLAQNLDTAIKTGREQYAALDALSEGVQVPMTDLQDFAAQELTKRGALPAEVSGNTGMRLLAQIAKKPGEASVDPAIVALIRKQADSPQWMAKFAQSSGMPLETIQQLAASADEGALPASMTFEQAQFFRHQLLEIARGSETAKESSERILGGIAKQLVSKLDGAMEKAAQASKPELYTAYRAAQDFWKGNVETLRTPLLRKVMQNPAENVTRLLQPDAVETLRELRSAVSPEAWQAYQSASLEKLLRASSSGDSTVISAPMLSRKLKALSDPTLKELFPADGGQAVKDFARLLRTVGKSKDGTGKMFIQLAQAGALSSAIGGALGGIAFGAPGAAVGALAGAAPILITPNMLSRILTNPKALKWLTTGLTMRPGSKIATRSAFQLLGFLSREGLVQSDASPVPSHESTLPPPEPPPEVPQ